MTVVSWFQFRSHQFRVLHQRMRYNNLETVRDVNGMYESIIYYTVNHKKTWHFIFDYNFG